MVQKSSEPLSYQLRPTSLEEFIGQEHLIGHGGALRSMIERDDPRSMVWFGPSGTGKTSLAKIISNTTNSVFVEINATMSSSKEIRSVIDNAKINKDIDNKRTIVYIDEIHRFNKSQLDILLPHVENGAIILICSTTENPFFCLVPALVSRLSIFEFYPMSDKDLLNILARGVKHYKDVGGIKLKIDEKAAKHLLSVSDGDARKLLSSIELAVDVAGSDIVHIDMSMCMRIAPNKHVLFDKSGDGRFDILSAIQGAVQASDVHGAIFFLGKAINSGEKLEVICRRLLVTASEDVGCSNPMAAVHTHSCVRSALMVGLPEASIILSDAVAYLAMQPRSKAACMAISKAMKLDKENNIRIPKCLRDCHYKGAKKLGRGSYQDGHNIGEYIRVAEDIFEPVCGDEEKYMRYNQKLWKKRLGQK